MSLPEKSDLGHDAIARLGLPIAASYNPHVVVVKFEFFTGVSCI